MLTKNDIQTVKGSKIIFETLKSLGVDTVFGYPGGIVLDLYNEFYGQSAIKHILVRHEQSAVHAAEGYARETGKCGVVLVTSGPGATNTVSGIVNAYLDGYPLIILTGQVYKKMLGKNAFQEANICDIVKSCTKKAGQITSASQIRKVLNDAFFIANSGKKGPVLIDIVKDVFEEKIEISKPDSIKNFSEPDTDCNFDISGIVNRLNMSENPVIISGGGVKHAEAEDLLLEFSHKYSIPVVNTMMGLGTFPQEDKNYFGMTGIFGNNSANEIIKNADLILSLGTRLNDRILCKFKDCDISSKLLQIDINPDEISNFVTASDYLTADIKTILTKLLSVDINNNYNKWCDTAQMYRSSNIIRTSKTNLLHSFEVIRSIEEFTKGRDITFTTEVGQHQLWAVQNLKLYKNRRIFVSGGSGTMGFGLPAAIGASVAARQKDVVCIAGDGSFQMNLPELAACKDYNLNVKIMILNNGYLGMVRQLQEKSFKGRYSETKISGPDYVTLAKSYGIPAERVTNKEELNSALKNAFGTKGTYLIDFAVEPMEVL